MYIHTYSRVFQIEAQTHNFLKCILNSVLIGQKEREMYKSFSNKRLRLYQLNCQPKISLLPLYLKPSNKLITVQN